jgi:hypothetical protein
MLPGPVQARLSRWKRRDRLARYLFDKFAHRVNRHDSTILMSHRPDFDLTFRLFPEFERYRESWIHNNSLNNLGDLARLYYLLLNVRQLIEEDVTGDFVELGVYKGNSAAVLADLARGSGRRLILFDTFTGFDERDTRREGIKPIEAFDDTNLPDVRSLVGEEGVAFVPGFFPESLAQAPPIERVALLHVDCDLHDPAKAALEAFYPRLTPGAFVILHDYASGFWPGIKKAADTFLRDHPERLILMPDKSSSAVFRKL